LKHTEFWARMEKALGPGYYEVWADQFVLASLGSRTARQALDAGIAPKEVWRAVHEALDLPPSER
jgi:hypothetical protein